MTEQELNVQLISLSMMEHKVLVLSRKQINELESEVSLKKSASGAVEEVE